ncbi:MAG: hypothetical protein ACJ8DY_11620, partial [Xanthobacteraceae bacterium]
PRSKNTRQAIAFEVHGLPIVIPAERPKAREPGPGSPALQFSNGSKHFRCRDTWVPDRLA